MPDARAKPLDGKALAKRMEGVLAREVAALRERFGAVPRLEVILVGEDAASRVYVKRKAEACRRVGIETAEHLLPAHTTETELLQRVAFLNADPTVSGILVQLPLPPHIAKGPVLTAIAVGKDVDAFHPESVGHALIGDEAMAPCTPQGILLLLDEAGVKLKGAEVCIVNHSNLIGKPLAAMLINRDATVTVCHKHTRDLAAHTRRADVLVTATGVPGLIRKEHLRPGAVVVDVGITRMPDGSLAGDVAPDAWSVAGWVTPVPGGVGPMTIAVLLQNTVRAFRRAHGLD
ncbi:MAG: methylenetetrahydrofolate dehydrogenase / methenyltetrahydrofolate cyclohydrolase [Thermoplasmata archaeon]|nr:methylenetetrahydrofolate dehydrogenase / methenyltetrahydrofolate cyclohydrolase [Thermoplasmata archaeon]